MRTTSYALSIRDKFAAPGLVYDWSGLEDDGDDIIHILNLSNKTLKKL